jgi:hypothetical protein
MTRISDINNRIEGHRLLFDAEVSTNGLTLPSDERMNINMNEFKRLDIRKIKCELSDNPGYRFSMGVIWYHRSRDYSEIHFGKIEIGLTDQTFNEIEEEIKTQINSLLQNWSSSHRFNTHTRYDNAINIEWTNVNVSNDFSN